MSTDLPPLPPLAQVAERVRAAFTATETRIPGEQMLFRTVFVLLYAGAVAGSGRWIRPVQVVRMTDEQALLSTEAERLSWASLLHAPRGIGWYAENTRESVRQLLRGPLLRSGAVVQRSGIAPQSAAPRWALDPAFAAYLTAAPAQASAALAAWLAARQTIQPPDPAEEQLASVFKRAACAAESLLVACPGLASAPLVRAAIVHARAAADALTASDCPART